MIYQTKEEIEARIDKLNGLITKTNDFFFIYGYEKEKEELERKLKLLV